MKPRFFRSEKLFREWLKAQGEKQDHLWVGFYKGALKEKNGLKYNEAVDHMLCFGWTFAIIKSIDEATYMVRFVRRKKGSPWSAKNIQRFQTLKKEKRVDKRGLRAFESRDRARSEDKPPEFSAAELRKFKSNKAAWEFFTRQTPSYQHYMKRWVTIAIRPETKAKRLADLMSDSAAGTKLKRIVEANERMREKHQKKFPAGATPIEEGKNIGPVSGAELRSIGIETLEQLQRQGWEDVFARWCDMYPNRLNANALHSLLGAFHQQHWRQLSPDLKVEARGLVADMKREFRS